MVTLLVFPVSPRTMRQATFAPDVTSNHRPADPPGRLRGEQRRTPLKRYKNHYPIVRGDGAIGTVKPTPPDTPAMRTDLIPLALPRTLLNQYSHRNDCTTPLQVAQVAAQRQNPPSLDSSFAPWMRPSRAPDASLGPWMRPSRASCQLRLRPMTTGRQMMGRPTMTRPPDDRAT